MAAKFNKRTRKFRLLQVDREITSTETVLYLMKTEKKKKSDFILKRYNIIKTKIYNSTLNLNNTLLRLQKFYIRL